MAHRDTTRCFTNHHKSPKEFTNQLIIMSIEHIIPQSTIFKADYKI